ncbi:1394_t:CDS:2 [Entrophospora sp. SA101]|nr:10530_t:CDS:2 [Entrophospora sp. SA101]CAJ0824208.1 1394_t:CDS:2 [Entrophospora sp. SA101]CAJ0831968.1 22145_t:CDS:2 [Entrophospora sp. SA101]
MSTELDLSIKSYFESTPVLLWSYLGFLKTLKSYCISEEHSMDDLKSIWRKRYINFLSDFLAKKEHDGDIKRRVTLLIRQDVFDKKSQIEVLDVLCISRSQKSNEYVNKVNSHLLEQAEISRREEVMETIPQTIMQSNSKDDNLFLDDEINDVSAEVQQFIAKMKRVEHRLFDYHIINLSERNQMDPVNKIFTDNEKKMMRQFWEIGEPSAEEKLNTVRRSKWGSIKQLINKYTSAVKLGLIFDEEELPAETIFERLFEGKLVFRTHYDMLWIQDVYKRL